MAAPSSSVPGYPDPDTLGDLQLLQALGYKIPNNPEATRPALPKRRWISQSGPQGRMLTAALAADHTTHIQTVLECPFDCIRIGIFNNTNVPLKNVRVFVGSNSVLGANNTATTITGITNPVTNTGIQNLTFAQTKAITFATDPSGTTGVALATAWPATELGGSFVVTFSDGSQKVATFTANSTTVTWTGAAAAGLTTAATATGNFRLGTVNAGNFLPSSHANDNPSVTWTDIWTNPSLARTDGGTLPILHVRVEVPFATNSIIPIYAVNDNTTNGWENEGTCIALGDTTDTLPFRRPWRQRIQSVLGVTTPSSFTSTATSQAGIPIIIQYIASGQVVGCTLLQLGDSIDEGNPLSTGSGLRGSGVGLRAQRDLSSFKRPLGIVRLTVPGGVSSRVADRAKNLLSPDAGIRPEIILAPIGTPNDEHSAVTMTFTAALAGVTTAQLDTTVAGQSTGWGGTTGTYQVYFSDGSFQNCTLTQNNATVNFATAVTASAVALATTWQTDLYSSRFSRGLAESYMSFDSSYVIWRTILPTNPSVLNLGISDATRRAFNAELINAPGSPKTGKWDAAPVLSAGINASGQELLDSAFTNDDLHPNDAGNEKLWQSLKLILQPLLLTHISNPS